MGGFTPQEREWIIESVIGSQALAGVAVSRDEAARLLDEAEGGPLPAIGGAGAMGAGERGDKANPEQLLAESAQLLRDMGVATYVHPELAPLVRAVGLTHEAIIAYIAETESRVLELERAAQATRQ